MMTFTSGRGGGHQQPTASAERAAARRRKALAHQSATDQHPSQPTEGFVSPSRKHVAKVAQAQLKALKPKPSHTGNRYDSLSDPEDDDDAELQLSEQEDHSNSSPTSSKPAVKPQAKSKASQSSALKRIDKEASKHSSSPKASSSSDTDKSEVESLSGSETSHTSGHSASTAPTQNITAQSSTPTPIEDQNIVNTSSEGPSKLSQSDGNDKDLNFPISYPDITDTTNSMQLDDPHNNTEPESVDNANSFKDKESHVQGSTYQQAEPINVRNNPSGALAHYEAQLKTFKDPVFSPVIEEQVRVKVAVGKERNHIQREAPSRNRNSRQSLFSSSSSSVRVSKNCIYRVHSYHPQHYSF
jgi:hypothetical protein